MAPDASSSGAPRPKEGIRSASSVLVSRSMRKAQVDLSLPVPGYRGRSPPKTSSTSRRVAFWKAAAMDIVVSST